MKKSNLLTLFALLFTAMSFTACHYVEPNGDEEAVLVCKPAIWGHGGVEDTPITSGAELCAYTTDGIIFKIVPMTYTEVFDTLITKDHIPVSIKVYIQLQIRRGQSATLYKAYGDKWYDNNIKEPYRALIRDKSSEYEALDLASDRTKLMEIQTFLKTSAEKMIKEKNMPVDGIIVTVGSVIPPKEVVEQSTHTASELQRKLTQDSRKLAEDARKDAETSKAIADKAYQTEMKMSIQEYLQLRQLEIEKEKIELLKDKKIGSVNVLLGAGAIPNYQINK